MRWSFALALILSALCGPAVLAQGTAGTRGQAEEPRGTTGQPQIRGGTPSTEPGTPPAGTTDPNSFFQSRGRGGVADERKVQDPGTAGQGQNGTRAINDQLFAVVAADGGQAEIAVSRIGVERATNPELKRLSQKMIQDHQQLNQQLLQVASRKQIRIPRMVNPRSQFCIENLSGLSGEKFDQCYAKAQLTMHMEAVAAFEAESERGQDAEMRAVATQALPHIKEHLNAFRTLAQQLDPSMGSPTGDRSLQRTSGEIDGRQPAAPTHPNRGAETKPGTNPGGAPATNPNRDR